MTATSLTLQQELVKLRCGGLVISFCWPRDTDLVSVTWHTAQAGVRSAGYSVQEAAELFEYWYWQRGAR